jgi:cytochrome c5
LFVLLTGLSSCYYDNEEALYPERPGTNTCDTANPTFSATISPIVQNNCQGCHSGGSPSGNLDLTTYENVVSAVSNKNLFGHLLGTSYSLMPPSGSLSECNINQFNAWISKGMPAK